MGSRAVWNFTLRDSVSDFINVTVWGAVDYVNTLFTTFTIGSVGRYFVIIFYSVSSIGLENHQSYLS